MASEWLKKEAEKNRKREVEYKKGNIPSTRVSVGTGKTKSPKTQEQKTTGTGTSSTPSYKNALDMAVIGVPGADTGGILVSRSATEAQQKAYDEAEARKREENKKKVNVNDLFKGVQGAEMSVSPEERQSRFDTSAQRRAERDQRYRDANIASQADSDRYREIRKQIEASTTPGAQQLTGEQLNSLISEANELSRKNLGGAVNRAESAVASIAANLVGAPWRTAEMLGEGGRQSGMAEAMTAELQNAKSKEDIDAIRQKYKDMGFDRYLSSDTEGGRMLDYATREQEKATAGLSDEAKFFADAVISTATFLTDLVAAGGNPAVVLGLFGTQSMGRQSYDTAKTYEAYQQNIAELDKNINDFNIAENNEQLKRVNDMLAEVEKNGREYYDPEQIAQLEEAKRVLEQNRANYDQLVNQRNDLQKKGGNLSFTQQMLSSATTGAIEAATEMLPLNYIIRLARLGKPGLKNFAKGLLASSGIEGSEEAVNYTVGNLMNKMILGGLEDDFDFGQLAYSFGLGAVSGAGIAAPITSVNTIANTLSYDTYADVGRLYRLEGNDVDQLIRDGIASKDKEIQANAKAMLGVQRRGNTLADGDVGKLFLMMDGRFTQEDAARLEAMDAEQKAQEEARAQAVQEAQNQSVREDAVEEAQDTTRTERAVQSEINAPVANAEQTEAPAAEAQTNVATEQTAPEAEQNVPNTEQTAASPIQAERNAPNTVQAERSAPNVEEPQNEEAPRFSYTASQNEDGTWTANVTRDGEVVHTTTAQNSRIDAINAAREYMSAEESVVRAEVNRREAQRRAEEALKDYEERSAENEKRLESETEAMSELVRTVTATKAKPGLADNETSKVFSKERREFYADLGRILGVEITFVDDIPNGSEGFYKGGHIVVSLNKTNGGADRAVIAVLAHEITHHFERTASKETYQKFQDLAMQWYAKTQGITVEEAEETLGTEEMFKELSTDSLTGAKKEVAAYYAAALMNERSEILALMAEDMKVARNFHDSMRAIFAKVKNMIARAGATAESKKLVDESEKLWRECFREARANKYNVTILNDDSVAQMSYTSWSENERERTINFLTKQGYERKKAEEWIKDVDSVAAVIGNDRSRLDYIANRNYKMLKKNGDYIFTLDSSTLCKKRLLYQGTFNAILKKLNVPLTSTHMLAVRAMMKEMGYEVPCGICYVESRRRMLGEYTRRWMEEVWLPEHPNDDLKYSDLMDYRNLETLRKERPEVFKAYTKWIKGRGVNNPKLVEERTDYRGEIKKLRAPMIAKLKHIGGLRIDSFSDFETPHLIDMMQAVVDMSAKGLTAQAYAKVGDFARVFGNTGIKINLSLIAKGVDKNGRLIYVDKEGIPYKEAIELRNKFSKNVGTIVVCTTEEQVRAAMKDPMIDFIIPFHRSGWGEEMYGLLGLEGAGDFTNYQNEKVRDANGNIVSLPKGQGNFYPDDYWDYNKSGKENAEVYLKMCADAGRIPKFWQFLKDNGDGTYSLPEDGSADGYWKMLIDFKMYDNEGKGAPQEEVKPNFEMDAAQKILDEYKGGANTLPVAQPVVKRYADMYKDGSLNAWIDEKKAATKDFEAPEEEPKKSFKDAQDMLGDIQFSISKTLDADLEKVLKNTFDSENNEVYIGQASNFLTKEIKAKHLAKYMNPTKAYAAMVSKEKAIEEDRYDSELNYHALGKKGLIDILAASETPLAAFASSPDEKGNKRLNRIVLVTDEIADGSNAAVIEELDTTSLRESKRIRSHKTVTVYDRTQIMNDIFAADKDGRLLYLDKKRSHLIKRAGVPGSNSPTAIRSDFTKNIEQFWANVKWAKGETQKFATSEDTGETQMGAKLRAALAKKESEDVQRSTVQGRAAIFADSANISDRWTAQRNADADPNAKAKPLSEIVNNISEKFGVQITTGYVLVRNANGTYDLRNKGIRTRSALNLPTIAHELGHALDDKYNILGEKLTGKVQTELHDALGEKKGAYAKKFWNSEGFAEFMRMYLQNKDHAVNQYPEAYAMLAKKMPPKDKAVLDQIADDVNAYYALSADTAASAIQIQAKTAPRLREILNKNTTGTLIVKMLDKLGVLYQDWVSSNDSIRRFDREYGTDVYMWATNSAYADAQAAAIILHDLTDINGQYVGRSLIAALDGVNLKDRQEYADFGEYLVCKHGPERYAEGMDVFADPRKNNIGFMKKRVAELEAKYPQFKEASERLYDFQKQFKSTYMVGMNLISAETSKAMDERWQYYVPFNRVVDMEKQHNTKGAPKSYANQSNTIKRAKGSGLEIIHPVDSIISNTVQRVTVASRNNVMLKLADAALTHGANASWLEKLPRQVVMQRVSTEDLKKNLEVYVKDLAALLGEKDGEAIIRQFGDKIIDQIDESLIGYTTARPHGNIVTVLRNGKPEFWKVNDPLLLDTLVNMSSSQVDGLLAAYGKISKFMSQNITGLNVIWSIFSNAPRDLATMIMFAKKHNVLQLFKGMGLAYWNTVRLHAGLECDPRYKEFLGMGGLRAGIYSAETSLMSSSFQSELRQGKGIRPIAHMAWRHPIQFLEFVSNIIENGPRYAVYNMMRETGYEPQKAFYEAMDITVNFRRHGDKSKKVNYAVPFFNAATQGIDKFARWLTAEEVNNTRLRKKTVALRSATFLTISSILAVVLYAMNHYDDDREKNYELLSNYTKNSFFCIPKGDGTFFCIPKPRELAVPTSVLTRLMDFGLGGDKRAFDDFYEYLTNQCIPPIFQDLAMIPKNGLSQSILGAFGSAGIAGTFIYLGANRDFRGIPIVGTAMEGLQDKEQYSASTTKVAKALGQAFNVSPIRIDFFGNSVGGGFWKVLKAIAPVDKSKQDLTLGVKNTYNKDPLFSNDIVNWIYDTAEASETQKNTYPDDIDAQVNYKYDNMMKSFYSAYNKLSKGQTETSATRELRREVLNKLAEYQARYDYDNPTQIRKDLTEVAKKYKNADFLPTARESTFSEDGKSYTLTAEQYADYEEFYEKLYDNAMSATLSKTKGMSSEDRISALNKTKTAVGDKAKEYIASKVVKGEKYTALSASDIAQNSVDKVKTANEKEAKSVAKQTAKEKAEQLSGKKAPEGAHYYSDGDPYADLVYGNANGGVSQAEMKAYFAASSLTDAQKDAIWSSHNWKKSWR